MVGFCLNKKILTFSTSGFLTRLVLWGTSNDQLCTVYYFFKGDAENMFRYFHLWLDNEKARLGNSSRRIGTKLYEAALAILHCLQNGQQQPNNLGNLKLVYFFSLLSSDLFYFLAMFFLGISCKTSNL